MVNSLEWQKTITIKFDHHNELSVELSSNLIVSHKNVYLKVGNNEKADYNNSVHIFASVSKIGEIKSIIKIDWWCIHQIIWFDKWAGYDCTFYGSIKSQKLVGVLESIDFKAVDFFQEFGSDQIYSIEFQPYYEGSFIFTKNLIVTHEGKIFSYDDDRLIKILEEYFEDDTYIDQLTWFVNQRYISIVNEEWFPEYLIEYDGHKETSLDVSMSLNIDHDTHEMMITIENRDEVKVDTGLAYDLDVNLDGKWYNISNVGKNNITMAFDALGFTIFPNMNQDFNHDLDHILPLPPGQYRVRKIYLTEIK